MSAMLTQVHGRTRRRDHRGVAVALITTVVINGALFALLSFLDREREAPPEALPTVHRLTVQAPPPPPEVIRSVRAATKTAATPVPAVIPAPPLPALDLPAVATGAPLPLPVMPQLELVSPPSLPTVVGAAAAGDLAGSDAAVPDATAVVDEPPVLINGFDLERFYPRGARLRGIEGSSTMRLEVGVDGKVQLCTVTAGTPPQVFDAAAQALGRTLRFSPGRVRGVPVPCVISQTVAWRLPR